LKYTVRITQAALADLERLEAFLVQHSRRTADNAIAKIRKTLRSLTTMPKRARRIDDATHALDIRFGKSGYSIWFRVEGGQIMVARIFHMREDR
jgi:plasmid stabilization system protein ParE